MDVSQAFLAAIVQSSDDAIIGVDQQGLILSWNRGAEEVYGYGPAEIAGQSIALLALPERGDEVVQILQKIWRGERVRHFETLHLRKNGRSFPVALSVSPVIGRGGEFFGASVIARDLSRRVHIEDALRESEQKYRLLFSAERDAILLFAAESQQLVEYNEAARQLYGYRPERFGRLKLDDLSTEPELLRDQLSQLRKAQVERFPLTYHRRQDGSIFPAEISLGSFRWRGQEMLVGIVRDVSDRLREQEIKQSLRLASEIQQQLLPPVPEGLEAVDLYAGSRYCEETGGDLYDFILPQQLSQRGQLGFLVGDISGHGIAAALLMAMFKGMLWSELNHLAGRGEPPQALLDGLFLSLNRQLVQQTDLERFLTLFCGILDPARRRFCWQSAGQGPVLLYRCRRQQIEELPTTGIPLGIEETTDYHSPKPLCLEAGDILLIGTDGLWESRNLRGEMFGTGRMRQIMATWAEKSAREIYAAVMSKVLGFCEGVRQEDDMTLMVVKIR